MKIEVNSTDVTLKNSFRAHIIYEQVAGESFAPKGMKEILLFFYSTIMASDKDIELSFEHFVDWADEHQDEVKNFLAWLTEQNKVMGEIPDSQVDGDGEVKKK